MVSCRFSQCGPSVLAYIHGPGLTYTDHALHTRTMPYIHGPCALHTRTMPYIHGPCLTYTDQALHTRTRPYIHGPCLTYTDQALHTRTRPYIHGPCTATGWRLIKPWSIYFSRARSPHHPDGHDDKYRLHCLTLRPCSIVYARESKRICPEFNNANNNNCGEHGDLWLSLYTMTCTFKYVGLINYVTPRAPNRIWSQTLCVLRVLLKPISRPFENQLFDYKNIRRHPRCT